MKTRSAIFCLGMVAILGMFAVANPAHAQEKLIKIGGLFPMSGPGAYFGAQDKQGIELAIEQFNKTGVNGYKLEVKFEDSACSPLPATQAAKRLLEQYKPLVVVGEECSDATLANEPVARLPSNPYVIVARKDLPASNLKELIAWLKANPDKATQGTAGPGSGQHVSGVYFQNVTGTRFQFVPYRAGSSEIMRDLLSGHIDLTFDQAITALPHVRGGRVKAYAVSSNKRLAAAPDIPTVDEAGAPGVYISTWYGMWVPKGTPQEAIRKLTAAAMDPLADSTVRERLAGLGQEIPPREQQSAEALAAHHKAEIEKWWPLIKAANIKAE